jgi:16S rRNA A1518/A1519 N6-dimethyltransferase RsmA/KsgA/DIM1 with predicted DNA glycosylase/AP lyase activity
MKSQPLFKILFAGFSIASLILAGCGQQVTNQAEAKPSNPENSTIQVQETSTPEAQPQERSPDVVYVPTPQAVVDKMLELAKVGKDDILFDLGSGDGRIPITAAKKFGTRGTGIDIDPARVKEANANAKKEGVSDKVQFRQQDLFKSDFSKATVVTLYLLPELNVKLRPQLFKQLKPGTRIVSHAFDMGDWKPEKVVQVDGKTVYYWTVPEKVPTNLR